MGCEVESVRALRPAVLTACCLAIAGWAVARGVTGDAIPPAPGAIVSAEATASGAPEADTHVQMMVCPLANTQSATTRPIDRSTLNAIATPTGTAEPTTEESIEDPLEPPRRVQLRSLETTEPLAFTSVRITAHDVDPIDLRTDEAGFFTVPSSHGYRPTIAPAGYERTDHYHAPRTLFVDPAFTLRVRAIGHVGSVMLRCRALAEGGIGSTPSEPSRHGVQEFAGLPIGIPFAVLGWYRGAASQRVVAIGPDAATRIVTMDLADRGTLEGVVHDLPADPRCNVEIIEVGARRRWPPTAQEGVENGRFRFDHLPTGEYRLRLCRWDGQAPVWSRPTSVSIRRGRTTSVALSGAIPRRPIEGIVLDRHGKPRGGTIGMWARGGFGGWHKLGRAGNDGRFRTHALSVGPQEIFVSGWFIPTPVEPGTFAVLREPERVAVRGRLVTPPSTAAAEDRAWAAITDGDEFHDRFHVDEQSRFSADVPRALVAFYWARADHAAVAPVDTRRASAPDALVIEPAPAGFLVLRNAHRPCRYVKIVTAGARLPVTSLRLRAAPATVPLPPGAYEILDPDGLLIARAVVTVRDYIVVRVNQVAR